MLIKLLYLLAILFTILTVSVKPSKAMSFKNLIELRISVLEKNLNANRNKEILIKTWELEISPVKIPIICYYYKKKIKCECKYHNCEKEYNQ